MTNKAFFKEEICELACEDKRIAVDKKTNVPCDCSKMACTKCALQRRCLETSHTKAWREWCNAEHEEPCPFEEGELVEVSDDKECWCLGYFAKFEEGMYEIRERKEDKMTSIWVYCQKYGTLGGLVKGEQKC